MLEPGSARHCDGVESLPVEPFAVDDGMPAALEREADQARVLALRPGALAGPE